MLVQSPGGGRCGSVELAYAGSRLECPALQFATAGKKICAGDSPPGGYRRGKEWEAGYILGLSDGDLIFLLNSITRGFDAGVVTPWAEMHLR